MKNFSPLMGKYLVKNPYLYIFLKSIYFFSFVYFKVLKIIKCEFLKPKTILMQERIKKETLLQKPKKILLANIAHLGDVLISLKTVAILKQKYPSISIGFICSSASEQIVKKFSFVDKIFILDHWKINRAEISKFCKFKNYFISKKKVVKKIKDEKYDVAIDLRYHFPNSIHLFYKAKIPIRIGYSSAGFENFLTHQKIWKDKDQHLFSYHLDLLRFLNIHLIKISNFIFVKEFVDRYKNQNAFCSFFDLPNDYIIVHIGAGSLKKMWDINKWIELTYKFLEENKNIVFTGKGKNELDLIFKIINFFKNNTAKKQLFNRCDRFDFSQLCKVVKNAELIICVDSFMLHLSTSLLKPTFVIYSGINNFHHWIEKKQNVIPIVKKMSCNPCYLKNGCKSMSCLNTIKVEDVLMKIKSFQCKN